MPKIYPERHEFWERQNSSALWAREMPKIYPERQEFRECHNSSLPWARESPNPTTKDTNFEKLNSLTPAKMPANKESIRFSRISHHI